MERALNWMRIVDGGDRASDVKEQMIVIITLIRETMHSRFLNYHY